MTECAPAYGPTDHALDPLLTRINDYLRDHLHDLPLSAVLLLDEAATALHHSRAHTPVIDRSGFWRIDRDEDGWMAIRLSDAWNPDLDLDHGISHAPAR